LHNIKTNNRKRDFSDGFSAGIPIGLGYLSVSFTFGMLAVSKAIPMVSTLLISMTNLTSAGQVAGIVIMAAGGSFVELALCQLVINLRYALMSLTISQRLSPEVKFADRFFVAFGMTDEIFAVMASKKEPITKAFYAGLLILPYVGWSLGTFLGSIFGNLMPANITAVLGIALYGMFLAIIIPPAKKNKSVLAAVLISAALSCLIYFVPLFKSISSGTSVIICAVAASALCAVLFPISKIASDKENTD
jgi:4-azaleucine resistance transporter AzlC